MIIQPHWPMVPSSYLYSTKGKEARPVPVRTSLELAISPQGGDMGEGMMWASLSQLCLDSRQHELQSGTNCGKSDEAAVPREFTRAQPVGTPEGQFFKAARGFSTVSQTFLIP